MADSTVSIDADDFKTFADQVAVNAPSGPIIMRNDSEGGFIAEWEMADGTPCRFGPSESKPLP
ncbi:MAG: hypothetical protein ACRDPC_27780 [Solirubrobacteraceae bacterium]